MLDDETEQPRALLIDGEAGIGKTTLFDGLLEMARERGFRSTSCRPTRSEMEPVLRRPALLLIGILMSAGRADEHGGEPTSGARTASRAPDVAQRRWPDGNLLAHAADQRKRWA